MIPELTGWHVSKDVPRDMRHAPLSVRDANGWSVAYVPGCDSPHTTAVATLIASAPALAQALADCLDVLRAIIDQGALKNVAHIPDTGDALRVACYDRITQTRALLDSAHGRSNEIVCVHCDTRLYRPGATHVCGRE